MLMPIKLNSFFSKIMAPPMASVAATPPDRESRNTGCKNLPIRKLPKRTLMNKMTKASLIPHHFKARSVTMFARPKRNHGTGNWISVSTENSMEATVTRMAIWAVLCVKRTHLHMVIPSISRSSPPSTSMRILLGTQTMISPDRLIFPIFTQILWGHGAFVTQTLPSSTWIRVSPNGPLMLISLLVERESL